MAKIGYYNNIILEKTIPVCAIAFTIGIYDRFKQMGVKIYEYGIDTTCKYCIL